MFIFLNAVFQSHTVSLNNRSHLHIWCFRIFFSPGWRCLELGTRILVTDSPGLYPLGRVPSVGTLPGWPGGQKALSLNCQLTPTASQTEAPGTTEYWILWASCLSIIPLEWGWWAKTASWSGVLCTLLTGGATPGTSGSAHSFTSNPLLQHPPQMKLREMVVIHSEAERASKGH